MECTLQICRADKKKWSTKYLRMERGMPIIDVFKNSSVTDHKGQILLQGGRIEIPDLLDPDAKGVKFDGMLHIFKITDSVSNKVYFCK